MLPNIECLAYFWGSFILCGWRWSFGVLGRGEWRQFLLLPPWALLTMSLSMHKMAKRGEPQGTGRVGWMKLPGPALMASVTIVTMGWKIVRMWLSHCTHLWFCCFPLNSFTQKLSSIPTPFLPSLPLTPYSDWLSGWFLHWWLNFPLILHFQFLDQQLIHYDPV